MLVVFLLAVSWVPCPPGALTETVWDVLAETVNTMRAIGGGTEAKYAELAASVPLTARIGAEAGAAKASWTLKVEAKRLYLGRQVPPGWTRSQSLFNYRLYLKQTKAVGADANLGVVRGSYEQTWSDSTRYLIYVPERRDAGEMPAIHPWHPEAIPVGTTIEWQLLQEEGPKLEAGVEFLRGVRLEYFDRQARREIQKLNGIAYLEENTVLVYTSRPGTVEGKSVRMLRLGFGAGVRNRAGAGIGVGTLHRGAHRILEGYRLSLDDDHDRETYFEFLRTGKVTSDLEPERFDRTTSFGVVFAGGSADATVEKGLRLPFAVGTVGAQVSGVVGPLARVVYRKDEVHYEDYVTTEHLRLFGDTAVRVVNTLDDEGALFDRTIELTMFDVQPEVARWVANATGAPERAASNEPIDFLRFVWTEAELVELRSLARERLPDTFGRFTIARWVSNHENSTYPGPSSLITRDRFLERLLTYEDPTQALFETLADFNFNNHSMIEALILLARDGGNPPSLPVYDFIQGEP